jgi:hypothetical protein
MKLFRWRSASWTTLALCLVFATAASANIVPPSFTLPPDLLTPIAAGPILGDTGVQTFTTGPLLSGTTREIVFTDLVTGNLDFVYAIHNNGTSLDAITRSTTAIYTGFITDVGYDPTSTLSDLLGFPSSVIPNTVDRSLAGDTGGFTFGGPTVFLPGMSSLNLVIETNAHYFTGGVLNFIDGGTATVAGFAPTTAPEPASLALMGTGIVFCARLLRRKKKNAEAAITA